MTGPHRTAPPPTRSDIAKPDPVRSAIAAPPAAQRKQWDFLVKSTTLRTRHDVAWRNNCEYDERRIYKYVGFH
jgi:hypothetical protein